MPARTLLVSLVAALATPAPALAGDRAPAAPRLSVTRYVAVRHSTCLPGSCGGDSASRPRRAPEPAGVPAADCVEQVTLVKLVIAAPVARFVGRLFGGTWLVAG